MSPSYGVGEAKAQLSKLVRMAERGEEVVVRRGDEPVVRLVALGGKADHPRREPGSMRGRIEVPEDFDEWPEDVARALGIVD